MLIDLKQPIDQSQDLRLLTEILGALVGQPCFSLQFSYAEELKLHLGPPISYSNPKMAGKFKGSWRVGTRASPWRLVLGEPGLLILGGVDEHWTDANVRSLSDEEIETKAKTLAGRIVTRVFPLPAPPRIVGPSGGIGLLVLFEDGSSLQVIPGNEPDAEGEEEPLADWEIFTPYHTYLRCGPGYTWSYRRSDVPAAKTSSSA